MKKIGTFLSFLVCLTISLDTICTFTPTQLRIDAKNLKHFERPTSYPFITGDTFRQFCTFIIDDTKNNFNLKKLRDGDTIFLLGRISYLEYFFKNIHPHITKKYILVTHNSDNSIPGPFETYLKSNTLVAWFGQNVSKKVAKLYPIPIGLANASLVTGNIRIVKEIMALPIEKNKLLYLNFGTVTNHQREHVVTHFTDKEFCTKVPRKPFKEYFRNLAESQFVISPNGHGIDCFRTWEALLCGSIPIVEKSGINDLFTNLPVIIVENWDEVTEEFLHKKYAEFSTQRFTMEKIYVDYWFDAIRKKQEECRKKK